MEVSVRLSIVPLRTPEPREDHVADLLEFISTHTARSAGRTSQANAGSNRWLGLIAGHRIFVHSDANLFQRVFGDIARKAPGPQVDDAQMTIGASRNNRQAAFGKSAAKCLSIRYYSMSISSE